MTVMMVQEMPEGAEIFPLIARVKAGEAVLHVALDDARMEMLAASLRFFAPEIPVLSFAAWDCIPFDRSSPRAEVMSGRMRVLSQLVNAAGTPMIVLCTVNAVTQRLLPRDVVKRASMALVVGKEFDRDMLTRFFVENGYINTSAATEAGEFALRGSILDIVPAGETQGYRCDFFGAELESIRVYDPLTQISAGRVDSLPLVPAGEVLLNEETQQCFRREYRALLGSLPEDDALYEAIRDGRHFAGMEHWLPCFYPTLETLFEYVPNAVVSCSHHVMDAAVERQKQVAEAYQSRVEDAALVKDDQVAYHPVPWERLYLDEPCWERLKERREFLEFSPHAPPPGSKMQTPPPGGSYSAGRLFHLESTALEKPAIELLKETLAPVLVKGKGKQKRRGLIACASEGSLTRLKKMLAEYAVDTLMVEDWPKQQKLLKGDNLLGLAVLPIERGYVADDLLVVSEADLLGEKIFRKSARRKRPENFLTETTTLSEGDYLVHRDHGIGKFSGLETLDVGGGQHDFVKLIYADDDIFYVPVENIDLLSRYGSSDGLVMLDKLGGVAWQKRTAVLKNRIRVTAKELLEVAAERELHQADRFIADGAAYEHFCATFPYAETEDQQNAIDDVLEDLASGRPMDRLVCGDVGFGKTEVALRAAFVVASQRQQENNSPFTGESESASVVSGGGQNAPENIPPTESSAFALLQRDASIPPQVALICPTTLLCRQHYQTFVKRFKGTKIRVRQLSRLATAKEQVENRLMMEAGEVEIVIGTHALLSKQTKFANLSLVIVDEEQRFGVAQKERLKKLRSTTHVLTLTATPIPRTLQLSLTGIRDLSLITTPPVDRLAVRTFIMPYDRVVIRDAILREHYRGGKVFYVCPRVKDIHELELIIKELVPEVKVVSAHGQMTPDKLDSVMNAFYDGKYDVLLATTIVESGLDVENANTLIVHRADMYGLAQLYQIRGRVGRGKQRAYAYLTLPPKRIPTETAKKRLEVMQKLDTLGAGFMLATHDMDIRGFGNLLGDEQSGQIKEVGVELYQHMLQEAIEEAKQHGYENAREKGIFSPKINLGIPVMIPEAYMEDLTLRMGMYRRIGDLKTEAEIESIAAELVDRFGAVPVEVENLLTTVKFKLLCYQCNIEKLDVGAKGMTIKLYQDYFPNPEGLLDFVMRHPLNMKLKDGGKLVITDQKWAEPDARLRGARHFLRQISELAEEEKAAA